MGLAKATDLPNEHGGTDECRDHTEWEFGRIDDCARHHVGK
jgi:hypothetical protein